MARRSTTLEIDGLRVSVQRKRIKHLYVKVSRADGAVRVSAPWHANDRMVRAAVAGKLAWIRDKQRAWRERPTRIEPHFVDGEMHRLWGEALRLRLMQANGRNHEDEGRPGELVLYVRSGATAEARGRTLDAFYRAELKARIPKLIECWEPTVGRRVNEWGVKKMRTRWGSCNPRARRIWVSLELAKHPPECLEYVVVHEMAHLIEANHSERFYALMDRLLPDWRERKRGLEAA